MGSYRIGALVEVTFEFRNPDTKKLFDPTTVRLRVENPAGAVAHDWTFGADPELTRTAEGKYRAFIDANASGKWHYYVNSTGSGQAAEEGHFTVRASKALT